MARWMRGLEVMINKEYGFVKILRYLHTINLI